MSTWDEGFLHCISANLYGTCAFIIAFKSQRLMHFKQFIAQKF